VSTQDTFGCLSDMSLERTRGSPLVRSRASSGSSVPDDHTDHEGERHQDEEHRHNHGDPSLDFMRAKDTLGYSPVWTYGFQRRSVTSINSSSLRTSRTDP